MPDASELRSFGAVFDTIAGEYERNRPTYPDDLIDRACAAGGLAAGDRVLEIGCGTGQLTRGLVARGLNVTAVEPGQNLAALAGRAVIGPGTVRFVNHRFEEAPLDEPFPAVFSAAAVHWIDPDIGWAKMARALAPGGLLALIQHCGLADERTATDDEALISALRRAAPEIAATWRPLRSLETILAGVQKRRDNVSEVWAWLGYPAVAREYAAELFHDVQIVVVPSLVERTAHELNALFGTTSAYHRMSPPQRETLERAHIDIGDRLGRPIRSGLLAVLVTARRI